MPSRLQSRMWQAVAVASAVVACTTTAPRATATAPAAPHGVVVKNLSAPAVNATAWVTTEALDLRLSGQAPPQPGTAGNATWRFGIDDTAAGHRQPVTGFGAAWTDATVFAFDRLPKAAQDTLLAELFDATGHGIGLRLMRHTIGQSDLTPAPVGEWSYDSNGGAKDDPGLTHFNLTDPGRRMVSWINRMQAMNPGGITLLGSPWSPPQWMKALPGKRGQEANTLDLSTPGGADAWVQYMVKYLQAFERNGIQVAAMTMQNEPMHSADPAWTMYMDATTQAVLAPKLAAAIRAAGLATEIWAYDHNTDHPEYPQTVLDRSNGTVKSVAWHCYSPDPWPALSKFHAANPSVKQYMTECWLHLDTGESFFDLPGFLSGPLQNWVSGALAWTLGGSENYDVSYPGGCGPCSGIIQVNLTAGTYTKTQDFYTLGQFSKFVKRDAVYLNSTGSWNYPDGTGVDAAAFLNPGSGERVLVIVNKIRNELTIQADLVSGGGWYGRVPARSVTTWVLPRSVA